MITTAVVYPMRSMRSRQASVVSSSALAALGIVVLAVAGRLASGWATPLWFDETFSAVIATQPNFSSLINWCLNEVGGPVYYVSLWFWAHLFGAQASALRSFSLLCSFGTSIVAWRFGPSQGNVRLYWAALLALWMPSFDYATNARCYALLLLVNTVQAITFLQLQRSPTRRNALVWTGLSALGILTHYQTAVLAGVQGILFVATHRRAAVRCWPALVALIPMACWMVFHLPMLLRFSANGAWYPPTTLIDLMTAPAFFFESAAIGPALCLGWVAVEIARKRGWHIEIAPAPERTVALGGLIAMTVILMIAVFKPSFTWRYAAVCAPSILFGIAVWMRTLKTRVAIAPVAVLAMFAASAVSRTVVCLKHPEKNYRFDFNLDQPSTWLADKAPHRLGFLWDNPAGTMADPKRMAEVASFFLRQAGHSVDVSIMKAWPGTDTRRTVADQVRNGSIDTLIWITDASVPGATIPADGPMLVRMGWRCHDFGGRVITTMACKRKPSLRIAQAVAAS